MGMTPLRLAEWWLVLPQSLLAKRDAEHRASMLQEPQGQGQASTELASIQLPKPSHSIRVVSRKKSRPSGRRLTVLSECRDSERELDAQRTV